MSTFIAKLLIAHNVSYTLSHTELLTNLTGSQMLKLRHFIPSIGCGITQNGTTISMPRLRERNILGGRKFISGHNRPEQLYSSVPRSCGSRHKVNTPRSPQVGRNPKRPTIIPLEPPTATEVAFCRFWPPHILKRASTLLVTSKKCKVFSPPSLKAVNRAQAGRGNCSKAVQCSRTRVSAPALPYND